MSPVHQEMGIILKSPDEIATMRDAGRVVAEILKEVIREVRPGMTTAGLDDIAVRELRKRNAVASFKGYHGYPASICTSVNEEVVHGIPCNRVLNEGDIVSLDFGAKIKGFHGDAAVTIGVGRISLEAQSIIDAAKGALEAGIAAVKLGSRLGDVSATIQSFAEARGFSVVIEYVGHGIGRELHEDPQVPNFGVRGEGPLLQKGMTIALEPMLNAGTWRTALAENKWTVITADRRLSAHFEHTIAIGDDGAEVLTRI